MIRAAAGLLALAALAAPAAVSAQVSAPRLRAQTKAQLPQPLPSPYRAGADARTEIAAGAQRARASGKRLLIDFGGNWCSSCRQLAAVVALPEVRPWMARHFELVTVDIGRFDRNTDIAARFGIKLWAAPTILVVDPRNGRLLNGNDAVGMGTATTQTPQQMANWFGKWARP